MRIVFNYRKSLRQAKRIQQITPHFSLPFPIELVPALTFIVFFIFTLILGNWIRSFSPNAFHSSWFMWLFGLPSLVTWLVIRVKPEGKNIYLFIFDLLKYFLLIKLPSKKYCHDKESEFVGKVESVKFRKMVGVREDKKKYVENSDESNISKLSINKRRRSIPILSSKKSVNSDAK